MMRVFYKSRLFRAGVPGLVFLLWVWWDSGAHHSSVEWSMGGRTHYLSVLQGKAWWSLTTFGPGFAGMPSDAGRYQMEIEDKYGGLRRRQFDFEEAFTWEEEFYPEDTEQSLDIWVALWVIVAIYVMTWLGVVWWWQRRKVRVMEREANIELPTSNSEL